MDETRNESPLPSQIPTQVGHSSTGPNRNKKTPKGSGDHIYAKNASVTVLKLPSKRSMRSSSAFFLTQQINAKILAAKHGKSSCDKSLVEEGTSNTEKTLSGDQGTQTEPLKSGHCNTSVGKLLNYWESKCQQQTPPDPQTRTHVARSLYEFSESTSCPPHTQQRPVNLEMVIHRPSPNTAVSREEVVTSQKTQSAAGRSQLPPVKPSATAIVYGSGTTVNNHVALIRTETPSLTSMQFPLPRPVACSTPAHQTLTTSGTVHEVHIGDGSDGDAQKPTVMAAGGVDSPTPDYQPAKEDLLVGHKQSAIRPMMPKSVNREDQMKQEQPPAFLNHRDESVYASRAKPVQSYQYLLLEGDRVIALSVGKANSTRNQQSGVGLLPKEGKALSSPQDHPASLEPTAVQSQSPAYPLATVSNSHPIRQKGSMLQSPVSPTEGDEATHSPSMLSASGLLWTPSFIHFSSPAPDSCKPASINMPQTPGLVSMKRRLAFEHGPDSEVERCPESPTSPKVQKTSACDPKPVYSRDQTPSTSLGDPTPVVFSLERNNSASWKRTSIGEVVYTKKPTVEEVQTAGVVKGEEKPQVLKANSFTSKDAKSEPTTGLCSDTIVNVEKSVKEKLQQYLMKNKKKTKSHPPGVGKKAAAKDVEKFVLSKALYHIRPYVISGWISSSYLRALMLKTDLVNEMMEDAVNYETCEVQEWIINSCRKTTAAILARDLVFRVFTLEELQTLDIRKFPRQKLEAVRNTVLKTFPNMIKWDWRTKCLNQIKISLHTLFQHRVRQVQDFWIMHS